MSPNTGIFAVVFVVAVVVFAWSCYRRFSLVRLGKADNRFDNVGQRIWNVIRYPLVQRCSISKRFRFGINHALLFWSFVVLLVANAEFLLHGLFPDVISLSRLPDGLYYALALLFDIVSIIVIITVILAVIRRLAFPPKFVNARSLDAFAILGMVAVLMLAFFGLHGSEIAHGSEEAAAYMPISGLAATAFFSGVSESGLVTAATVFWWIHAVVLLVFLNYLPYSKHMHVLTSIPNIYFKNLAGKPVLPREEFKKGNSYGAARIDQFTWKSLFDSYSCTECGRCSNSCPATLTGKVLDPRLVIHDIKYNLLKNGPLMKQGKDGAQPLIGGDCEGSIAEDAIWECTTCGACVEVCPVFIEHFPKIIDMRRYLVEMNAKFPPELHNLFENMEQRSNPWGMAPTERTKWTEDINAPAFEPGQTEYLFYVGCAGAFDTRSRQITQALARILTTAGISWGILGKDEMCCGDSLRRLGNEYVFDDMARKNIEQFTEKGITKIITQCPHCYNTFKNEYGQFGTELEVIHHTELINRLLDQGKLELTGADGLGKIVFHDSCYLGRHNNIYEAPRRILASATGKAPTEMERHHDNGFCCGAGGGCMWMENRSGERIDMVRVKEALQSNPETICVCCPYCLTMFTDGLKDENADEKVRVLDIAEIVAGALKPE